MLDLSGWESFCECVSNHVVGRAVNKMNRAVFNNILNEMEADVNMLGTSMVLVVFGEGHSGLIGRKEHGRVELAGEEL